MRYILSNVFPTSLMRRKILVQPIEIETVRQAALNGQCVSAWGHENTLTIVSKILGTDIKPKQNRPAIILDNDFLPTLYGEKFNQVLLVSPSYIPGFRPAIGEPVTEEKIVDWQALLLDFNPRVD
jgi:hypothetical protein